MTRADRVSGNSVETKPALRVLQICGKSPWPKRDGAALAADAVCRGLLEAGAVVRVLALETDKHPFDPSKVPAEIADATQIEAVYVDTNIRPFAALKGLAGSDSYLVARFRSQDVNERVAALLRSHVFDVVILESSFLGPVIPAIRANSDAAIVLRAHNVEHALWQRRGQAERHPVKRLAFARLARQLATYEARVVNAVDAVLPITTDDGTALAAMVPADAGVPMQTLPFAVPLPESAPVRLVARPNAFHLGSMDWAPNQGGLRWFLNACWPRVRAALPTAELHLAGRHLAAGDPSYSGPGVSVHGEVADADAFTRAHRVMIVPLLAGGGMRTKLVKRWRLANRSFRPPSERREPA